MAARRQAQRILTGDKELDALLQRVKVGGANSVSRAGLRAAARVGVKGIKSEVTAKHKSVRKAIGHKVGQVRGKFVAKLGAAVGKKASGSSRQRSGRDGVGISERNIHWYVLGTRKRAPKQATVLKTAGGMFLGTEVEGMPPHPIVRDGIAKSQGKMKAALVEAAKKELTKQVQKAVKKRAGK